MNIPATGHVIAASTFLLLAALLCPVDGFPSAAETAGSDRPVAEPSLDLLGLYQKAAAENPDGYVQQFKNLGAIGLLEAVETSLAKSLALNIQKETVNIAKGQYQSQGGAFDLTLVGGGGYGKNAMKLDSFSRAIVPYEALDSYQATTSLGLSQQLRIGPVISFTSQLLRTEYTDHRMAQYAATADPKTTAIVKLEAKIPLLNGAGRFAASGEAAALLTYEAGQYDYVHAIFQNTLSVVQKYWDYKAAFFTYDVNVSMENLIRQLLDRQQGGSAASASSGGKDGDQQSIILNTLKARLADASRNTSQARQNITTTRQAFALALGIEPANYGKLAVPADDFNLDGIELDTAEADYLQHLTESAMNHRPDLKSLSLKVKAAEVLVDKARNNLKPRLDLIGSVGYTGLDEDSGVDGYLASATDVEDGEAWSAGATLTYPLGNHTAEGLLLVQDTTRKISAMQQNDLKRQISSQLTIDIAALKRWIANLKQVNTSVEKYWQALYKMMQAPIGNNSDLADLLDLQEKLRDAELSRSDTLNGFAKAIATARFNSGTLVGLEGEKTIIDLERLTTLP
jgi:outer membrane protein TolC